MSTSVHVNLFTHTVTFVTDKMLSSLRRIIVWSGLDPSNLLADWDDLQLAIKTWLGSRDLTEVMLEVFNSSSGGLVGRWDFDIDYGFGSNDDGDMWVDTERN
jgi:Bacterial HORMA domain 2